MADIVQAALGLEQAKAGARMAKGDISAFTQPVVQEIETRVKASEEARKNFLSGIPKDYEMDLVPVELKAKLTTFLKDKKQEYIDYADTAGKYANNPNSSEYINAVEGMEQVKASMNKNYEDLMKYKQLRTHEIKNENLLGWLGSDPQASLRRDGIVTGTNFDTFEFTNDGAYLNDGFGDKVLVGQIKKSPSRNVNGAEAINNIGLKVRKMGRAGESKEYLDKYVNIELGKLFADQSFKDEVFNIGLYGDPTGETIGSKIAGSPDEMVSRFADIIMEDHYAGPLSKGKGKDKEEKDFSRTINALDNNQDFVDPRKDYITYEYNPKSKKYKIRVGNKYRMAGGKPVEYDKQTLANNIVNIDYATKKVKSGYGPMTDTEPSPYSRGFDTKDITPQDQSKVNNDFAN